MTTLELLQNSPFWSEDYQNFQAFKRGASDWLKENGLITTDYVDVEPKAVVYFDEYEPDYGKYKTDRMAKEAQSTYAPILHSVITIEEYNQLPQVIAEREAEAKRKAEKDEIINAILSKVPAMMEGKQKEADAAAYAKNLALIEQINGRKYKFAFHGKKYETYEQADAAAKEAAKNSYYNNKSDLAYCMKYAKEGYIPYQRVYFEQLGIL